MFFFEQLPCDFDSFQIQYSHGFITKAPFHLLLVSSSSVYYSVYKEKKGFTAISELLRLNQAAYLKQQATRSIYSSEIAGLIELNTTQTCQRHNSAQQHLAKLWVKATAESVRACRKRAGQSEIHILVGYLSEEAHCSMWRSTQCNPACYTERQLEMKWKGTYVM